MKTSYIALALFVSICFLSYSQKYYTLTNGNWNNTTNVWSLNGVTPCGCYPGNSLVTDSIFVSHPITMTANISASSLSKVQINASGSLNSANYRLAVNNSLVFTDGTISIKEINIGTNGNLVINNSSMVVGSRILNSGTFEINHSDVIVIGGNLEVYSTGKLYINDDSYVHLHGGNYRNQGLTTICDSCCLVFQAGNITNESSGTFSGDGNIISEVGNISNLGSWSTSLSYCTSGFDTGMPAPENCAKANDICKVIPLPSEIVYFNGFHKQGKNILEWKTSSEMNVGHYSIEKSEDGVNWNPIGVVASAGNSNELMDYSFEDQEITKSTYYYKLTSVDTEGKSGLSKTVTITNHAVELMVYPNPTANNASVRFQKDHSFETIRLYDAYGRLLAEQNIENVLDLQMELPNEGGLYFLQAEGETSSEKVQLVKI